MKSDRSSFNPCVTAAPTSGSASPSTAPRNRAATGATLTEVLERAWKRPFKTKSDFARLAADIVAMAASDGLLTTKIAAGLYGHSWQITPAGLARLWVLTGYEGDEE